MTDGEGGSGAGGDGLNLRVSGASAGDPVKPKRLGNHGRSGGSGSPVSCRKSTSVIPQVSTVCPVRTRTPGLRSAQGAIASAPGPTRKKHPEGGPSEREGPRLPGDWRILGMGRVRLDQ